MSKNLEKVMKKMCQMAGANFAKIDFKKPNWFCDYTWTEKQEQKFMDWLAKLMLDNKEVRQEFMCFPSNNKKDIAKFILQFCMNFGWKTRRKTKKIN